MKLPITALWCRAICLPRHLLLAWMLAGSLSACAGDPPGGLGATTRAGGVRVAWDMDERPLPKIPLPNDQATLLDKE